MKLELLHISFSSKVNAPIFEAEFTEGIHRIHCPTPQIRKQLVSYLTDTVVPPRGIIRFLGYDIRRLGEAYRNHISFFTQYPFEPETYTLYRYLLNAALSQRLPLPDARKKAHALLDEMKISYARYSHLSKLSSYARERIDLYQTVLAEAPILILDEDYLPMPGTTDCSVIRSHLLKSADSKIILLLTGKPMKPVFTGNLDEPIKEDPFPDLPRKIYVVPD